MIPVHEHQKEWDAAKWQEFQRMKDDHFTVNPYMAEIDTRIDKIVLEWRMTDAIVDGIIKPPKDMWERFGSARRIAEHYEHNGRPVDLQRMIEQIRASDGFTIPTEREAQISFGAYDGNDDKYLALVLDYAGPNFADDETGDTDWGEHVQRFGRCLLGSDDQGFKSLAIYDDEDHAKARFEVIDFDYSTYMSAQDSDD